MKRKQVLPAVAAVLLALGSFAAGWLSRPVFAPPQKFRAGADWLDAWDLAAALPAYGVVHHDAGGVSFSGAADGRPDYWPAVAHVTDGKDTVGVVLADGRLLYFERELATGFVRKALIAPPR